MTDIVDLANRQIQQMLDVSLRRIYTAPANDVNECDDCGGPIGAKRKQAMPSTTRCIVCQSALESRQGPRR